MSIIDWDHERVRRGLRSMHAITSGEPRYPGIPEEHSPDCTPGAASIEVMGPMASGMMEINAVCSDCGAYLDRLYLGQFDVDAVKHMT